MIKKLLFATTNDRKIGRLKQLTDAHIISFSDLNYNIPEPDETGRDVLDISILKARHYWEHLDDKVPVLTQDDAIQLGVRPEDNPGTSIKKPVVDQYGEFSDKLALDYYTDLVLRYGGSVNMYFEYGHSVCFENKGEIMVKARRSRLPGRLVAEPRANETTKDYFLSAIMQVKVNNTWKYYSELTIREQIAADSGIKESLTLLLE